MWLASMNVVVTMVIPVPEKETAEPLTNPVPVMMMSRLVWAAAWSSG